MIDPSCLPRVVLLGPQRLASTVDQALDLLQVSGTVAVITAGWQEREDEDGELKAALGRSAVNLMLHDRGEAIYREDPALFVSHRAKQDQMRQLQDLYRRRLRHMLAAARQMQSIGEDEATPLSPELVAPHFASSIEAVQKLDAEHLRLVNEAQSSFEAEFSPVERPSVVRQRREVEDILRHCSALAIAGGHVVVLLNRLRLLGLEDALARMPIVAWSAGAMALTDRIVLFHDNPPQGLGDAEILGAGLGLISGVVVLPHARRRLLLDNQRRIELFARRFAPATCAAMDERCRIVHYGDGRPWQAGGNTSMLTAEGTCVVMSAEASCS